MIDLSWSRQRMLGEIGASSDAVVTLEDPLDPSFVSADESRLVLKAHSRDELLPILVAALRRRFPDVPDDHLGTDLFYLLKKGLGNAYKKGNRKDHAKWITVDVAVTYAGAVVTIADEGEGFDVQGTLEKFQRQERFYENGGSGFRHFESAKSVVSYDNGGRTLHICFLSHGTPGRPVSQATRSALGKAGDEEFMRSLLQENLPRFLDREVVVESCRAFAPEDEDGKEGSGEVRYVVQYVDRKSKKRKALTLTGRIVALAAARTDHAATQELCRSAFKEQKGVRIPRPVAFCEQPPLVLQQFDPVETLRRHMKRLGRSDQLGKLMKKIAVAVLAVHMSALGGIADAENDEELKRVRSEGQKIGELLGASPDRVRRVRTCVDRLVDRAPRLEKRDRVTIHGSLGWDSFAFGRDEKLYLFRFDRCRRSHPGFDLGGFLADHQRFNLLRHKGNPELYRVGRDAFLRGYAAGDPPAWFVDLDWFVAEAMLQRVGRMLERGEDARDHKVDAMIERCEELLG